MAQHHFCHMLLVKVSARGSQIEQEGRGFWKASFIGACEYPDIHCVLESEPTTLLQGLRSPRSFKKYFLLISYIPLSDTYQLRPTLCQALKLLRRNLIEFCQDLDPQPTLHLAPTGPNPTPDTRESVNQCQQWRKEGWKKEERGAEAWNVAWWPSESIEDILIVISMMAMTVTTVAMVP